MDNPGPGLFRRSYDAWLAEWLDQHQRAQRLMCTCEPDTLPAHAVPLASGGYADDLARTFFVRSYKELNDFNQLTTSSLPWDDVLYSYTQRSGVTLVRLRGKHSTRDLRAALLGDWKAPERLVTASRHLGAQRTIEVTATTDRAARCGPSRTAFAQGAKYHRSKVPRLRWWVPSHSASRYSSHGSRRSDPSRLLCLAALQIPVPLRTRTFFNMYCHWIN